MRRRSRVAVAGLLAACAGLGVTGVASAAGERTGEPEVRAYVNESCVIADEPWLAPTAASPAEGQVTRAGPITALVVGKLAEVIVSQSIKATAGRLSQGAARRDTRYAFARETNLYRVDFVPEPRLALNARLGCITLVAAVFADEASCHEHYQPRVPAEGFRGQPESEWRSLRADASLQNVLRRGDICLQGAPHAVFEARFEFSADGTAWRLVNAGYHIDSLLTTRSRRATRTVFYTLEALQPSGTAARGESLTTGLVAVGRVAAGAQGEASTIPGPWLRVPPLNAEARRSYELRTALHQETWAEIGALERALRRNELVLAEVRQRRSAARGELAKGLAVEETRLAVQRVTLQAELAARRAEYAGLSTQPHEFMPVGIEVGLTETRSEQQALLAIAAVMKQGSGLAGVTAGALAVARSIDAEEGLDDDVPRLDAARTAWHDARVARRIAATPEEQGAAQSLLDRSRSAYAAARQQLGLAGEVPP